MAEFFFVDIGGKRYTHDREPNECPICHFAIQPNEGEWTLTPSNEGPVVYLRSFSSVPEESAGTFLLLDIGALMSLPMYHLWVMRAMNLSCMRSRHQPRHDREYLKRSQIFRRYFLKFIPSRSQLRVSD